MTLSRPDANPFARPDGWTARMIHPLSDMGVGQPGSFVTTDFKLAEVTGDETLFVTAWGLYRATINGQCVGEDVLTPGWTNYDARLSIQSYNVSHLLRPGVNTITISLGDGWFRSPLMWTGSGQANVWGDKIGAFAELRTAPEGEVLAATDGTWKSGETEVRKSGIYFGEIFDARVIPVPEHGVAELPFNPAVLVAQECTPVREMPGLQAVKTWTDDQGRTIFDFGQNIGGYVAFSGTGSPGAHVRFEHAEVLDKNGEFYNVNYRSAAAVT